MDRSASNVLIWASEARSTSIVIVFIIILSVGRDLLAFARPIVSFVLVMAKAYKPKLVGFENAQATRLTLLVLIFHLDPRSNSVCD